MAVAIFACRGAGGAGSCLRVVLSIDLVVVLGIVNTFAVHFLDIEGIVAVAAAIDIAPDMEIGEVVAVNKDMRDFHLAGKVVATEDVATHDALLYLDIGVAKHVGNVATTIDVVGHDNQVGVELDVGAGCQTVDRLVVACHVAHVTTTVDIANFALDEQYSRHSAHGNVVVGAEDGSHMDVGFIVGR